MTDQFREIRLAMWSGPRNISTAMMRSFENRGDTAVWDEPFYAAYLKETGLDHPMRDEVIAAGETDWQKVIDRVTGPIPGGKRVFYEKHMTQHMIPGVDRSWLSRVTNCFLIRRPENVLASYSVKRQDVALTDIGFVEQAELFKQVSDALGAPPPVIDAADVLNDPKGLLTRLCGAIGLAFTDKMLHWPAGRRANDGVWAPHWYAAVEKSTGFAPAGADINALPANLAAIADAARPYYEELYAHRLTAVQRQI
ncbi:MAG: hypothetical protein K8F25_13425 [Fimbriimonadaceae bacterium]|nr:hypothetical protein [Alphaproteobacteria bacterium]